MVSDEPRRMLASCYHSRDTKPPGDQISDHRHLVYLAVAMPEIGRR